MHGLPNPVKNRPLPRVFVGPKNERPSQNNNKRETPSHQRRCHTECARMNAKTVGNSVHTDKHLGLYHKSTTCIGEWPLEGLLSQLIEASFRQRKTQGPSVIKSVYTEKAFKVKLALPKKMLTLLTKN